MQIYHYHPSTGEYLGDGLADANPVRKGSFLIPANATNVQPPAPQDGQVRFWDGAWKFKEVQPQDVPLDPEYEPNPIPQLVTPRQAKLALLSAGLLDDVDAAIDAIADPATKRVAQIEWEYAQEIKRDWPLLVQLATSMGMTSTDLDELFTQAALL